MDALGMPFFLMEWRAGTPLFAQETAVDASRLHTAVSAMVRALGDLHLLDASTPGLCNLGAPKGFVERLIRGFHQRWVSAAGESDDASAVAAWLSANVPKPQRTSVLHNDYKPDNILLNDSADTVVAVLDWELCSIGDPLVDVGLLLAYWPDESDSEDRRRANLAPRHAGLPSRRAVLEAYASASVLDLAPIRFYEILGLFKVAVLMEQIVVRGGEAASRFAGAPLCVLREARATLP
jgi:aminoglycoside phosphotransferase (APT) family kinase protein